MIRPLHNRVLVQRFDTAVDRVGSIIVPDVAKERPNQGDVVAVGPGHVAGGILHPLLVKVGDKILFGKYSGTEVMHDGKELLMVKEEEILAVIG